MKKTIFILFATTACGVSAQNVTAVGNARTDFVQLVDIEQLPFGAPKAELDKARAKLHSILKAEDGFSSIEEAPETIRQFMNNLELAKHLAAAPANAALAKSSVSLRAPVIFKDLSELELGFGPAVLNKGVLIGAAPSGTMIGNAWTGVDRYYRIEGAGHARLSESDMKPTGGMFYMLKSEVNTSIGGKPAISKVFTDEAGVRVEEVLWVRGSKLYVVTFAPEMQPSRYGKSKANPRISAVSLASELR
jgi:hypothetical protein